MNELNSDTRVAEDREGCDKPFETLFNSYASSLAARVHDRVSVISEMVSRFRETLHILERFFRFP